MKYEFCLKQLKNGNNLHAYVRVLLIPKIINPTNTIHGTITKCMHKIA